MHGVLGDETQVGEQDTSRDADGSYRPPAEPVPPGSGLHRTVWIMMAHTTVLLALAQGGLALSCLSDKMSFLGAGFTSYQYSMAYTLSHLPGHWGALGVGLEIERCSCLA